MRINFTTSSFGVVLHDICRKLTTMIFSKLSHHRFRNKDDFLLIKYIKDLIHTLWCVKLFILIQYNNIVIVIRNTLHQYSK